jgi:hypothetical protein
MNGVLIRHMENTRQANLMSLYAELISRLTNDHGCPVLIYDYVSRDVVAVRASWTGTLPQEQVQCAQLRQPPSRGRPFGFARINRAHPDQLSAASRLSLAH